MKLYTNMDDPKSFSTYFHGGPDPTDMVPKIELHRHPHETHTPPRKACMQ